MPSCVTLRRDVYAAVVFYCHSSVSVMKRFLYRAQDHNMTNGDFAFFTFEPFRSFLTDHPWRMYTFFSDDDPDDLPHRRRAFYAVKQVLARRHSPFADPSRQNMFEHNYPNVSSVCAVSHKNERLEKCLWVGLYPIGFELFSVPQAESASYFQRNGK